MSKIARIRILNLNYNNNTIRIDDETFDLGGQNTLISLRNGGGKSVLVQMIVSLFVHPKYRDFGDRPFRSYFTTNRPTFLMTEWILDNERDHFLAGIMVRKSQKEDNDAEALEMYAFTGSYTGACKYDLDNLPVIRQDGNKKILKGFAECRSALEELSKNEPGDFRLYDMGSTYGQRQYFTALRQFQIDNKEWESIIKKVNQKESGLSELFRNAKDEKDLVENWFLRPIEDKLNREQDKIQEFQKLAFQFIGQYRSNQSKIRRKGIIERYFEDTKPLKERIDDYVGKDREAANLRTELILYARALEDELERLTGEILQSQERLEEIRREHRQIEYEKLSFEIYRYEDEKAEILSRRVEQELEITRLTAAKAQLVRQIDTYDLHKLYLELRDFELQRTETEAKLQGLLRETEKSKDEVGRIGARLHALYAQRIGKLENQRTLQGETLEKTRSDRRDAEAESGENEERIRRLNKQIGALEARVSGYDEAEDAFNREFGADVRRNLLGLYEEGFTEVFRKELDAGLQEQKNRQAACAKKRLEQEKLQRRLSGEEADHSVALNDIAHRLESALEVLTELERQKKERLRIMKYVDLDEKYADEKALLLDRLDGRIRELDVKRTALIRERADQEKHYSRLREGKTTEIPENIRIYLDQHGIDLIYGMEWLSKNGRTAEENAALVRKNPFLPYAILMERADFERFQKNEEELYTSLPIPIIIKDELEGPQENASGGFASFRNVHFYVMFNTHLLDHEELERVLTAIRGKIDELEKAMADKEADLRIYRGYRSTIGAQTWSTASCEQTKQEIEALREEQTSAKERLQEIRREKNRLEEERKQAEKLAEAIREQIDVRKRERAQADVLFEKYEKYETDRKSLERLRAENTELAGRQNILQRTLTELREQETGLRGLLKELADQIAGERKKAAEYEPFSGAEDGFKSAGTGADGAADAGEDGTGKESLEELEARYNALTREISGSIEELGQALKGWEERIRRKRSDLKKKNEDSRIPEEEYQEFICPEEQYDSFKRKKKQTETELNLANEENTRLGKEEGALKAKIESKIEGLREKTGYEEPASRKDIRDTEFEKRLKLKEYDAKEEKQHLSGLEERKNELASQRAGVEEYEEETLPESMSEKLLAAIREHIPDIRKEEIAAVRTYQKDMRRNMAELTKALEGCRYEVSEFIRELASEKEYADDYFSRTFDSLLSQTASPGNLSRQFEMNLQAYENQLEKLRIDLAYIDDEQKNLEVMFLEYIEQINGNIGTIDKNSTITVRGRSLKMLRIQVPDWETEKEHFRLKLHDYFEHVVKTGIDALEKNQNLDEFLGKVITTRKLYDDIVGIRNVKIRLYKIEAEREVPISWSEVSANSGGEGFLSAFVILTSLLSYMRRDETDVFAAGEEGKVLIMDNPFAQTNAEHLLKPLMEMARKTNTQLICLSGLGGDSIYNRFDNIYVLKLIESSIRNGVRRVDVTHMKGEETKRMVLSDFKMEQMSLFDI